MSLLLETTDSGLGKAYTMVSIGSQARQVRNTPVPFAVRSVISSGVRATGGHDDPRTKKGNYDFLCWSRTVRYRKTEIRLQDRVLEDLSTVAPH